jgi:hypothetical protein
MYSLVNKFNFKSMKFIKKNLNNFYFISTFIEFANESLTINFYNSFLRNDLNYNLFNFLCIYLKRYLKYVYNI